MFHSFYFINNKTRLLHLPLNSILVDFPIKLKWTLPLDSTYPKNNSPLYKVNIYFLFEFSFNTYLNW